MEKKRISKDGTLYIETTPEIWAKEITEKYNMLPDLKTIYVNRDLVTDEKIYEIFTKFTNRYVSFDIDTEFGEMELNGIILDVGILRDDKRNAYDFLFIPDEKIPEFLEIEKKIGKFDLLKIIHLGHFINVGTARNFKLKNK